MRVRPGLFAVFLSAASGCVFPDGDDKPVYASDNVSTRPWATCLATNVGEMDDGASDPWAIGQAIAEACAPDLLSAFRREPNGTERRKAYALTAEKAVALIEANRRERASSMRDASAMPTETAPASADVFSEEVRPINQ